MANIRVMDPSLANQIAAGEVVERPASVVKELVENALDAQATQIDIEVREGGLQSIRVADNGDGMDEEDAILCFERHATSKIKDQRDLFRIRTLGFRGEALPSIAAVAKIELQTKGKTVAGGIRVCVESGKLVCKEPIARNQGTDITVRDLFYNTPARLKYVKSLQTEFHHISDYVSRMAILHPGVQFRLYHQERLVFQTPGDGQFLHVMAAVYGNEAAKKMIAIQWSNEEYKVTGCIGAPEFNRASRQHMNLYVNGRSIRNFAIQNGILRAYHTRLPIHRYPIVALQIEMDPVLVDPNVHPNKTEVRFSEEGDVVHAITSAVSQALEQKAWIPQADLTKGKGMFLQTNIGHAPGEPRHSPIRTSQQAWTAEQLYGRPKDDREETMQQQSRSVLEQDLKAADTSAVAVIAEEKSGLEQPKEPKDSGTLRLQAIAQVLGMYIVAQDDQAMYIIDQHAAHERVLFETFTKKMQQKGVLKLPLLVPYSYEVRIQDLQLLKEHTDTFEQIGIEFECFGGNSVLVRTVPTIWEGLETQQLVQDTFDELLVQGYMKQPLERIEERIIMKSCKAAIKANRWLSMPEMQALCDQLSRLDNPFSCPHGRPVIIRLTTHELEKQFKRIQ